MVPSPTQTCVRYSKFLLQQQIESLPSLRTKASYKKSESADPGATRFHKSRSHQRFFRIVSPQSKGLRTRTLCVRLRLGQSLNKPEKTPVPHQRFGCFFVFVGTQTLLASIFLLFFCHTIFFTFQIVILSESAFYFTREEEKHGRRFLAFAPDAKW